MQKRIISGVLGAALLIIILFAGDKVINAAAAIVALLAVYEGYTASGLKKKPVVFFAGLLFCPVFTFAHTFNGFILMPLIFVFIAALFAVYMTDMERISLGDIGRAFFLSVYIGFFLGHIMYIRRMPEGRYLVWFVFICAFLTDIFAMLGGIVFGKRKLCPGISPKKTVEGALCGIVGSVLGTLLYCLMLKGIWSLNPNFISALVMAVTASIAAQFGDLSASCIKRQYHVKDYGSIMPGHGGVLDRLDSVIFTAPFVYYFITMFPIL